MLVRFLTTSTTQISTKDDNMPFVPDNSVPQLNKEELKATKAAKRAGGFFQRLNDSLAKRKSNVMSEAKNYASGNITKPEYYLRGTGQVAGAVGDVAGAAITAGAKAGFGLLSKENQGKAKEFGSLLASSKPGKMAMAGLGAVGEGWNRFEQAAPRAAANVAAVGNIASVVPVGKGAQIAGREALRAGLDTKDIVSRIGSYKLPEQASRAVGQIVQGKTKDIKPALNVLSRIDTKKVKSYADLKKSINENTKSLTVAMDEVLSKDQTKRTLDQLNKVQKVGDTEVSTNYIATALAHLRELYENSNDPVSAQKIVNLTQKAETEGLTVKEMNDIAKQYGSEYGEKAFTKLGEPRTSVNAVGYENTRKGVKETMRELLPDDTARELDKKISENIRVEELAKTMEERANKLLQTVNERGILEKAGGLIGKAIDIASLHSVSGFLGGIAKQSNVGLKTMNALDLEKAIQKNLDIIKKAQETIEKGKFTPRSFTGKTLQKMKGKGGMNIQDITRSGLDMTEKEWTKLNNSAFMEALKDYGRKLEEKLKKARNSPKINLDTLNRLESAMDDVAAAKKAKGSLSPEAAKLWSEKFKKLGIDFDEYYSLPEAVKMKEKVR